MLTRAPHHHPALSHTQVNHSSKADGDGEIPSDHFGPFTVCLNKQHLEAQIKAFMSDWVSSVCGHYFGIINAIANVA